VAEDKTMDQVFDTLGESEDQSARTAVEVGADHQARARAFGLTTPLVTKSDGGKFGKTESGAVWLSAHRTSPYAFYQFWLNSSDEDVVRYLKIFTVMPHEEVETLIAKHRAEPGAREAHRALARHVTELLHGPVERDHAEIAARALFSGEVGHLPLETLNEVLAAAPSTTHDKSLLSAAGTPLIDILAQTSLADSKGKARQLLAEGSISVNGHKAAPDARLSNATLLHGSIIALRRGKKSWHVTRWE
jgi:tyrosyl-tRNA synthetase